jgi:hypothetical protein
MKKLKIYFVLTFSVLLGTSQKKMLITDFVFFNNFDTPTNPNIDDYFKTNADQLDSIKTLLLSSMASGYELDEVVFDQDGINFLPSKSVINPNKGYEDNHKRLIKEGGYDYFLLVFSHISQKSSGYDFKMELRLSNRKGKKEINNSINIQFSSFFTRDEIATSELFQSDDFFNLFSMAIPAILEKEKTSRQTPVFFRSKDLDFEEFCSKAEYYSIQNYKTQRPVLKKEGGESVLLRIKSGSDTDASISESKKNLVLAGVKVDDPIVIGIKNPALNNNWIVVVNEVANEKFEDFELAPSANIIVRIDGGDSKVFRLINGRLVGKLDSKSFTLSYEPSASLLRVLIDKELVGLSQPVRTETGPHVKFFYKGSPQDLNNIINLHQLYFQTLEALNTN